MSITPKEFLGLVRDFSEAATWSAQQPGTQEARTGYSWYATTRHNILRAYESLYAERKEAASDSTHARIPIAELEQFSGVWPELDAAMNRWLGEEKKASA